MPATLANFGCEYQRLQSVLLEDKVINVDIRDNVGADVLCNLAEKLPFDDGYFDGIYASHVLEHFSYKSTINILKEWRRTIKINGFIEIKVPSFEFVIREYARTGDVPLPDLYGGQGHMFDVHLACFDKKLMNHVLYEAGFAQVHLYFEDFWGHKDLSLVAKAVNLKEI